MYLRRSLFSVFVCLPLMAQMDQTSLKGTVTDASRSVIHGAKVEVVSSATGLRRQTATTAAGAYQIPGLAVGTYTITFSLQGFRTSEFKNVELAVGQTRTIDAQLAVGAVAESVEVTAPLETLNRSSAEVG